MTPRTPAAAALRAIADDLMEAACQVEPNLWRARRRAADAYQRIIRCNMLTHADFRAVAGHLEAFEKPAFLPGEGENRLYAAARLLQVVAARVEGEGDDAE